jgi:hypothetical protein
VVLNRGDGPVAYRNDTSGPSVVVRGDEPCSLAGVVVTATTSVGSITALLAPVTFLGGHAAELAFGAPPGPIEIEIRRPGMAVERQQVEGGAGRQVVVVDCPDRLS